MNYTDLFKRSWRILWKSWVFWLFALSSEVTYIYKVLQRAFSTTDDVINTLVCLLVPLIFFIGFVGPVGMTRTIYEVEQGNRPGLKTIWSSIKPTLSIYFFALFPLTAIIFLFLIPICCAAFFVGAPIESVQERHYFTFFLATTVISGIPIAIYTFPMCKIIIHNNKIIHTSIKEGLGLVVRNFIPVLTISAVFTLIHLMSQFFAVSATIFSQGMPWHLLQEMFTVGNFVGAYLLITAKPIYYVFSILSSTLAYAFSTASMVLAYLEFVKADNST